MLKILTGRQSDPLHEKILAEAVENYEQNPELETFIIVPNHIKFTTEIEAITKLAGLRRKSEASVKNLHILSFSRLAWFFLQDRPEVLKPVIDEAASSMLLEKIVTEKKNELILFNQFSQNSGLIKQIYQSINEVSNSDFDLIEAQNQVTDEETKNKLHDLAIIKTAFDDAIAERFITKQDFLNEMNIFLAGNNRLKNCSFYFVDFSQFNGTEQVAVELFSKQAQKVVLAFATEDGKIKTAPEAGDYDYVVQKTIKKLQRRIIFSHEQYESPVKDLTAKQLLDHYWTGDLESNEQTKPNVQLIKADSRYDEAYFVARTIYQQVSLNKFRYQDFLVLAPNLHEYETYLTPILRQNGIPFFNDLQKEMKYHPLVIFIESLQTILETGFESASLFALLKTRLFIPAFYHDEAAFLRDVDELENFVLAHGINYYLWNRPLTSFVKIKRPVITLDKRATEIERLEKLRQVIIKELSHFIEQFKKTSEVKAGVKFFFDFLVKIGLTKRLETWRKQAIDKNDLQASQEPKQIWDLLLNLLNDFLLINKPEEEFSASDFLRILISGFKEANFAQIPASRDAVSLSEMGMVQAKNYKNVFIIGASSSNLPQISNTPGFLTSENLAQISSADTDNALEDRQELANLDQDYQFGACLTLASNWVYVSYPFLNTANESIQPSTYYTKLQELGARELEQADLPKEDASDILSFTTNAKASLGYLTNLSPAYQNTLLDLAKNYAPQKYSQLVKGRNYNNQPVNLGEQLARELYGVKLTSSVSQLETYYQNSLEYFFNYGLRLRPRAENELDVIQAGNYFHQTFDYLVKYAHAQQIDLATLSNDQILAALTEVRKQIHQEGSYEQLLSEPFNQYLFTSLDKTVNAVAFNWKKRMAQTPFRPAYSELAFGSGNKLAGLKFKLDQLREIDLRGKIDRVDLAPYKNELLGQVIDYKSSSKNFDLALFASGISLQMVSYLDVLAKNASFFGNESLDLLGAFYQTITKQVERLNKADQLDSNFLPKKALEQAKQRLVYSGLLVNNEDYILTADPELKEPKVSSKLYKSVRSKARGGLTLPRDRHFTEDELKLVLRYNEYLIRKAGRAILTGDLALNPYQYGQENGLKYSSYQDIFFFDAKLAENSYRKINSLDKASFMQYIKEILEKEEDNG